MKKIIILLSLLTFTACSTTRVHNLNSFLNASDDSLKKESEIYFKESKVDDFIPLPVDSIHYHESLIQNMAYRNYLYIECLRLLGRDSGLMLNRPVYVSIPTWNRWTKMFDAIFNFEAVVDNVAVSKTMSCDLAIDNKKVVKEYQLKDFNLSLVKEN